VAIKQPPATLTEANDIVVLPVTQQLVAINLVHWLERLRRVPDESGCAKGRLLAPNRQEPACVAQNFSCILIFY
jgi:hypothetical protein